MERDDASKASEIRSPARALQVLISLPEYRNKFLGAALGLIAAGALKMATASD